MDLFYLIIIIVALVVFFLDRTHCIIPDEKFSNFPSKTLGVDYSSPSSEPQSSFGTTNIKLNGVGFSKFGPTPPNPRCNITVMGENCTNYRYDTSINKYQSVCQKSYNTYPNRLMPEYVMGRSLGRVRQCKNLYSP
jgi:hypothetical protein